MNSGGELRGEEGGKANGRKKTPLIETNVLKDKVFVGEGNS